MLKIRRPLGRLIFNMGIAIPGKTVFLIETAPWCCQIIEYIMSRWPYSYVCTLHHIIIIIIQTNLKVLNLLVSYSLPSVCLRLSQFSQLSFMQYMGLCVSSLPISFMVIVKIYELYLIIVIKPEEWHTCHCLGLCHETMVCAVCLSISLCFGIKIKEIQMEVLSILLWNAIFLYSQRRPSKKVAAILIF